MCKNATINREGIVKGEEKQENKITQEHVHWHLEQQC